MSGNLKIIIPITLLGSGLLIVETLINLISIWVSRDSSDMYSNKNNLNLNVKILVTSILVFISIIWFCRI